MKRAKYLAIVESNEKKFTARLNAALKKGYSLIDSAVSSVFDPDRGGVVNTMLAIRIKY